MFLLALALAGADAPLDISDRLRATRPGSSFVAPPGQLVVSLNKATFNPPITVRGGTFERIEITNGGGVVFAGGTVRPSERPVRGAAVYLANVADVTFFQTTIGGVDHSYNALSLLGGTSVNIVRSAISGVSNGVRARAVDGLTIRETTFSDLTGDGVGLTASANVTIDRNTFAWGEMDRFAHPDAIQVWDSAGTATRDIAITRNLVRVYAQGIFVKSEGHGGFDRVTISGNDIATDYVNALVLTGSRDSVINGNRVRTLTGKKNMARIGLNGNRALTFTRNWVCQMYETAPSIFLAFVGNVIGKECTPLVR